MNQVIFRKRLLPLVLLLLPLQVLAAGAARLDFASGEVNARSASGDLRSLAKGSELQAGDTILTGREGRAQLRFSDGAMVSLQPQSEFHLDDYRFAGKVDGEERSFFRLLKGGLRTLTGLIGRANRDNYKVTTSVATIGIRGTEYTVSYLDPETLAIATGEGRIEVCNQAGCLIVASGEAAIVRGNQELPRLTDSRPRLDPAQPLLTDVRPLFSSGEESLQSGGMVSGPGYTMQFASNSSAPQSVGDVTAQFDSGDLLLFADAGVHSYQIASGTAEAGSRDGVIGWGRWTAAIKEDATVLPNFHYVIGQMTSLANLTGLGDGTYTYSLANGGATTPINSSGVAGTLTSGSMVAMFSGGSMELALALGLNINSVSYTFNGSLSPTALSPTFNITNLDDGNLGSGTASGMFVGANAQYVGVSYTVTPYNEPSVVGAAALGR
jgi:hypothetical protein